MTKGIDVSKYQGNIDFKKVKADGIKFVIINAGYGKYLWQKDPNFEKNYKGAKAAGLAVGAYWYSYAKNAGEAEEEARVFLEAVKGKKFEYPLALDIEDESQVSLTNDALNAIIERFCGYLEKKKYYAAVYSYASFLNNRVWEKVKKRYDVWVANFDVKKPDYTGSYGIWQYTSAGSVKGISGKVDMDYAYKDYPSIIKNKGLNGYSAKGKFLDENGFKHGDKGDGMYALKQLLLIAKSLKLTEGSMGDNNLFGEPTEQAVNALLKRWGYTPNGIAGDNFISRLGKEILKDVKK